MTLFVSPAELPRRRGLDLFDEPAGAELDDGVALLVAVRRDQVDDERVAVPGRALAGGNQLGHGLPQSLELLCDELLGHLGLGAADLERRPVDDLDLRLHGHDRLEAPVLRILGRQLVVEPRLRDRTDARARRGVPEPAGDVAVDRLGVDPLLAEPLDEDRLRHLALAETGDLDGGGEVVRRVLDRVVDVVRGDVDRQPNRVVLELLDGGRHPAIQAEGVWPRSRPTDELVDPPLDLVADRAHPLERPADRILDPPVDVGRSRENRADVAAAHGHDHVRPGRVRLGIELSRAAAREVDPELAHRLHHLRMELVTRAAPGGAHLVTAVAARGTRAPSASGPGFRCRGRGRSRT